MRAHYQEQSKQNILLSLQKDEVFIISDWAIKILQIKFREKQSEWFAKRGINWLICSVVARKGEKLEVSSYAYLFNSCSQDWFTVLSILENLMSVIKKSDPLITKAYLRSDEAGCYHNSSLLAPVSKRHWKSSRNWDCEVWLFWAAIWERHVRQDTVSDESRS